MGERRFRVPAILIQENTDNNLNTISQDTWFSHLGWKRGWGGGVSLSYPKKVRLKKHCEIVIQSLIALETTLLKLLDLASHDSK